MISFFKYKHHWVESGITSMSWPRSLVLSAAQVFGLFYVNQPPTFECLLPLGGYSK